MRNTKTRPTRKPTATQPVVKVQGSKIIAVTTTRPVTVHGIGGGVIPTGTRLIVPHAFDVAYRGDGDRVTVMLSGTLKNGRALLGHSTCDLPSGTFTIDPKDAAALARNHRRRCPVCCCDFCTAARKK